MCWGVEGGRHGSIASQVTRHPSCALLPARRQPSNGMPPMLEGEQRAQPPCCKLGSTHMGCRTYWKIPEVTRVPDSRGWGSGVRLEPSACGGLSGRCAVRLLGDRHSKEGSCNPPSSS